MPWLVGYPRDKVNWGPTIDYKKGVRCGMCMNCGKKVYEWVEGRPMVARRNDCMTGCTSCANLCMGKAIDFPPLAELRAFYKREKMWNKVKEDLINNGVIPRDPK
jgi:NAD-dependent dihydropyrimidine dehydrogenase PreA subunit